MSDRIEEIRKRLEKATPEPWKFTPADECDDWMVYNAEFTFVKQDDSGVPVSREDGDLIAHAPDDLKYLIDEVERLERWQKEALIVSGDILKFEHPEMRIGDDKFKFVLRLANERDHLKAEVKHLKAFNDDEHYKRYKGSIDQRQRLCEKNDQLTKRIAEEAMYESSQHGQLVYIESAYAYRIEHDQLKAEVERQKNLVNMRENSMRKMLELKEKYRQERDQLTDENKKLRRALKEITTYKNRSGVPSPEANIASKALEQK